MCSLRSITYLIVLGMLLGFVGAAWAHDPGLSAAALRMTDTGIEARLTFARREMELLVPIDVDRDGAISTEEFAAARPHLNAFASRLIEVRDRGQRIPVQVSAVRHDASDALHVHLTFAWQTGLPLRFGVPIISRLAHGHRQYVSLRDGNGDLRADCMLGAGQTECDLPPMDAATSPTTPSLHTFLRLGVVHIVMGYDHLLFLIGLLVAGGSLRSAGRMITSFTLAHSIALAAATFGLVRLPGSVVESFIAASIVYVGMENLWRRDLHRRCLLTFGFGLVHGLGFASVLRDLGLGAADGLGVVAPLLAFNGGVELGQLAVAVLVLPLLQKWQRQPIFFARFSITCSVLLTLAGAYWLFERTVLF